MSSTRPRGSFHQGIRRRKTSWIARRASSDAALVERFARAQAEGDLPDTIAPDAMACYIVTVMQGMAVKAASGTSRAALERLIETTLAIWPGR